MNRSEAPRIEQVIGATTELKQIGSNLVGWHRVHPSDSKTSLHVDPDKQIYYCFHCGQGGDVYDWIGYSLFGDQFNRKTDFKAVLEAIENRRFELNTNISYVEVEEREQEVFDPSIYMEYHKKVQRGYWYKELGEGELTDLAIDHFKLGFCEQNPLTFLPSHTIPVFVNGECVNIRHRVIGGDLKYLPHKKGLGAHIYNHDIITRARAANRILVVAGEKKVVSAWIHGLYEVISPTIGCSFKDEWVPLISGIERVYVLFDPGEEAQAEKVGLKLNAKVLHLPSKLDDFLRDGGTVAEVFSQAKQTVDEMYWVRKLGYRIRRIDDV